MGQLRLLLWFGLSEAGWPHAGSTLSARDAHWLSRTYRTLTTERDHADRVLGFVEEEDWPTRREVLQAKDVLRLTRGLGLDRIILLIVARPSGETTAWQDYEALDLVHVSALAKWLEDLLGVNWHCNSTVLERRCGNVTSEATDQS